MTHSITIQIFNCLIIIPHISKEKIIKRGGGICVYIHNTLCHKIKPFKIHLKQIFNKTSRGDKKNSLSTIILIVSISTKIIK